MKGGMKFYFTVQWVKNKVCEKYFAVELLKTTVGKEFVFFLWIYSLKMECLGDYIDWYICNEINSIDLYIWHFGGRGWERERRSEKKKKEKIWEKWKKIIYLIKKILMILDKFVTGKINRLINMDWPKYVMDGSRKKVEILFTWNKSKVAKILNVVEMRSKWL